MAEDDGNISNNSLDAAIDRLSLKEFEAAVKGKPWNDHNRNTVIWAFRTATRLIFKHGATEKRRVNRKILIDGAIEIAKHYGDEEAAKELQRIFDSASFIEDVYSEILDRFEQSEIAKLSPEQRISACLYRACEKWYEADVAANREMSSGDVMVLHHQGVKVKLDDIPTAVAADQIQAAAMSSLWSNLNMECYINDWIEQSGDFTFPDPVAIQPEQCALADATFDLAGIWHAWQKTEESFRYLDGVFDVLEAQKCGDELPSHIKDVLKYNPSENEQYLHRLAIVANHRFNAGLFQNYVEMMHSTNIVSLAKGINDPLELAPNGFVNEEEAHAATMLSQIFGFAISDDEDTYGGLRLIEWLRGFATLQEIARMREVKSANDLAITLTNAELVTVLQRVGLKEDKASRFIAAATLTRSSRDLFDAPLLKLRNGNYILVAPATIHAVLPRVVISVFSNAQYGIERKGFAFEASIIEFLKQHGYNAVSINTKIAGEQYDFDVLFVWGDYIFWFECKNRSIPGTSPIERHYFYDRNVTDHIKQVSRLSKALSEHPEILVSKFGEDARGKTVVPCILNSLPFSIPGKTEDIYFTDASIVRRFFEESTININMKVGKVDGVPVIVQTPVAKLWDKQPTPEAFLRQLERPAQVIAFLREQHVEEAIADIGGEFAFVVSNIYQHPLTPETAKHAFEGQN